MNCLTYARVSTDKQAEKELSIPAQVHAMRQYASDRGWHIVQEFSEAGASARTADRPALRQLMNRCREEGPTKVDVVLVHKLDRLARNLADHVAIRSVLRAAHVTIASATEGLDDSVSGQLVEHILAAMAEFYSANLSEEVKKGMRQKVLQGGWPHQLPRGYRLAGFGERRRVAVDEVQGPLIRQAFEICANDYRGVVDLPGNPIAFGGIEYGWPSCITTPVGVTLTGIRNARSAGATFSGRRRPRSSATLADGGTPVARDGRVALASVSHSRSCRSRSARSRKRRCLKKEPFTHPTRFSTLPFSCGR